MIKTLAYKLKQVYQAHQRFFSKFPQQGDANYE